MAVAVPRRLVQHLLGHVDADDAPAGPHLAGRDEAIEPGARADIDHLLAGRERAQRKRIADTGEGFDRGVGQGIDDGVVVAQPFRQRASGVKVIRVVRIDRHGAVLVLDFLAKRDRVDRRFSRHNHTSCACHDRHLGTIKPVSPV